MNGIINHAEILLLKEIPNAGTTSKECGESKGDKLSCPDQVIDKSLI